MTPLWKLAPSAPVSTLFAPDSHHDAIVVGAGLTGLSTAVMLAREGLDVAVVEAGEIGELASGGNTGKLSLLQGQQLAQIRRHHPASLVRAYVDANRAGMRWLTNFADEAHVTYRRRTDHAYATGTDGLDTVRSVHDAAREAGLNVRMLAAGDLSTSDFPASAAVALDDQATIDPMRVAHALAGALLAAGGTLHTGIRVTGGSRAAGAPRRYRRRPAVRGAHRARHRNPDHRPRTLLRPRSAGCGRTASPSAFQDRSPRALSSPSTARPARSVPVTDADGPADSAQLVVGGNGHPVGRSDGETAAVEDLVAWTQEHFPEAEETHRWSAQDYESHNLIPFVGAMPRGLGRIRFATGYAKWG